MMKQTDQFLEKIEAFDQSHGGGVFVERRSKGYSLFLEEDGRPLARLRPTGNSDEVEVLWWSYRDKWESIGDLGGIILPLEEALDYVAKDPMGCFWP